MATPPNPKSFVSPCKAPSVTGRKRRGAGPGWRQPTPGGWHIDYLTGDGGKKGKENG
ncbi:MAG: hypothetical protein M5U34_43855 [Chloroflexi bacterium]|nr:hypothetical protein [Chloroflexota bacterium]